MRNPNPLKPETQVFVGSKLEGQRCHAKCLPGAALPGYGGAGEARVEGFRVWGLGLRGLGFRFLGLGFRAFPRTSPKMLGAG